ncbi:MAG: EFR1 family ferrodoxin [bacterium]|nr:EFR1 family ferrodoxin [bacterium]
MGTCLYYYTGTGNSLWVARQLAAKLQGTELISISAGNTAPAKIDSDRIGIVFPVHMWGLPRRVKNFAREMAADRDKYYFAVALNGGQVAATLLQLKKLMQARGLTLAAGFEIHSPSNYIPWGGAAPAEEQKRMFAEAGKKIERIAGIVSRKESAPIDKGPLWKNILLSSLLYKLSFPQVPKMDKKFWVDGKCNSCAVCEKICPAKNIVMNGGKPTWQNRCEQCLACIQWCPKEAIQYGKKTPGYARYHHPEIKLTDMLHGQIVSSKQ